VPEYSGTATVATVDRLFEKIAHAYTPLFSLSGSFTDPTRPIFAAAGSVISDLHHTSVESVAARALSSIVIHLRSFVVRPRMAASMIGTKKHSDLPDPVPVVTTKLCYAVCFRNRLSLMAVKSDWLTLDTKN
jgi:hypothetical protein